MSPRAAHRVGRQLNARLEDRLQAIRDFAVRLWANGDPLHPLFTLHGPQHSRQVEQIVGEVLALDHRPAEKIFRKRDQLFYLLAAVWLHDVGMKIPPTDWEKAAAQRAGASLPAWIRDHHHSRSRDYVLSHFKELGLRRQEAAFVGEICQAHRKTDLLELGTDYPNLQFLGAVLRVADELDISAARAPEELFELLWGDADPESRWHWLKHWCIPVIVHYHDEAIEEGRILRLSYQLTIRVPAPKYGDDLVREVIGPIRRVLDKEGANVVLRSKRIEVRWQHFGYSWQLDPGRLPDGSDFGEALDAALKLRLRCPNDVAKAVEALRARHAVAGDILQRRCQKLPEMGAAHGVAGAGAIDEAVTRYLWRLSEANAPSQVDGARSELEAAVRAASLPQQTRQELLAVGTLGWRLFRFLLGDPPQQELQLRHLAESADAELKEFYTWVIGSSCAAPVRALSVALLARTGAGTDYWIIYRATEDGTPEVRLEAVRALRSMQGPGTVERLGRIVEREVDGLVRAEAVAVLSAILQRGAQEEDLQGLRILLVYYSQEMISLLADGFTGRGASVRVVVDECEIRSGMPEWGPSVVVCELSPEEGDGWFDGQPDRLPGLRLARVVRESLGDKVPIITTSALPLERVADELVVIRAAYVQGPTSTRALTRAVEALCRNAT
jgi:hypothetical protein